MSQWVRLFAFFLLCCFFSCVSFYRTHIPANRFIVPQSQGERGDVAFSLGVAGVEGLEAFGMSVPDHALRSLNPRPLTFSQSLQFLSQFTFGLGERVDLNLSLPVIDDAPGTLSFKYQILGEPAKKAPVYNRSLAFRLGLGYQSPVQKDFTSSPIIYSEDEVFVKSASLESPHVFLGELGLGLGFKVAKEWVLYGDLFHAWNQVSGYLDQVLISLDGSFPQEMSIAGQALTPGLSIGAHYESSSIFFTGEITLQAFIWRGEPLFLRTYPGFTIGYLF